MLSVMCGPQGEEVTVGCKKTAGWGVLLCHTVHQIVSGR